LAKRGLLLNSLLIIFLISGCTSSTQPTFPKEGVAQAIQDICKNEYKLDVTTKLVGETLWIYLPVEDILVPNEKPDKYTEKFSIENDRVEFEDALLRVDYSIKNIPDMEKTQGYKYNKDVIKKIGDVWKVLRRVIFSMEHSKRNEPKFFCLVTADIKTGIETQELFYYLDMKKVSYGFISWEEYQHRAISNTNASQDIIGDKTGSHLLYKDITMKDFIARQIQHRIKIKFQKPEVGKNADIDKEILKVIAYVMKTYDFEDFDSAELNNLLTSNKIILNQAAVRARSNEQ